MLKTLNSAIANAVHNEGMEKKDLKVALVTVDKAQTYKRGRAVARGRYHQIFRRNSHITIGLSDGSEFVAPIKEVVAAKTEKSTKSDVAPKKAAKATVTKTKSTK